MCHNSSDFESKNAYKLSLEALIYIVEINFVFETYLVMINENFKKHMKNL